MKLLIYNLLIACIFVPYVCCTIIKQTTVHEDNQDYLVYKMRSKGDVVNVKNVDGMYEDINFFCYDGVEPHIFKFWSSAFLQLDMDRQDYQVYIGPNVTAVNSLYQQSESSWWYTQLPWRSTQFKIDPFQDTCIGVKTAQNYSIELNIKNVNYIMVVLTVGAILVYFWAPKLCRNHLIHYTTGIGFGILLSLIILTYLVQQRVRAKWMSWIGIFYSLSAYFMTVTWYNFKEYLTDQYFHWVVGYVLVAGLLSAGFIYRFGTITNPRTMDMIQWVIQGVSLVMIVLSSYYQVASLSLALSIFLWSAIPGSIKSRVRTQFKKTLFRPKVKLLSEEEYQSQRNEETRKALEELRNYCRSPDSKPWLTVTKLTSPSRFAEFVEGSPHISEREVIDYSHWDSIETDDEDRSDLTDDGDNANRSLDSQSDHLQL
jgi:hypothetical protein